MEVKHINPFLSAVENVLGQFGIQGVKKGDIKLKEDMTVCSDIIAFVGIVGQVRGNISYSFNIATAKNLISSMMMGMTVDAIDEIGRSAIAELANMFTGNAIAILGEGGTGMDITPPSVVMGEEVFCVLGSVKTLLVDMETPWGVIEINFGLEI